MYGAAPVAPNFGVLVTVMTPFVTVIEETKVPKLPVVWFAGMPETPVVPGEQFENVAEFCSKQPSTAALMPSAAVKLSTNCARCV